MYIWPSKAIRDSFKVEYLRKLECNLQRMKIEKQQKKHQQKQSSANQKLLDDNNGRHDGDVCETAKSVNTGRITALCHDLLVLLSCCYCCFCCGACIEEE